MVKKAKSYDSSNIRTLQFPDNIRQKPTMYIGPIDESGIFTILREVTDNVVDEALAERASICDIFFVGDQKSMKGFYVLDDGVGIPVKPITIKSPVDESNLKVPAIKAILTMTHTSGKFDDSAYAAARGTHGVGIKATNALSRSFKVWTFRDGAWWHISYAKGCPDKELHKCPAPKHPGTGKNIAKGTLVYIEPDPEIFEVMQERKLADIWSLKSPTTQSLLEWCRIASYFTTGLKLRVTHNTGPSREFFSENGPLDFISRKLSTLNKERKALDEKAEEIQALVDGVSFVETNPLFECIVVFTNADIPSLDAFTNGLRNADGGVHLNSMMSSCFAALQPLIPKGKVFTARELREGMVSLINIKLSAPQFNSQTKEKLVDARGGKPVGEILQPAFSAFFKKHKELTTRIIDRAANLHALRSKFMASKQVIASLRNAAKKGLPVKGAIAPNCQPSERELYIIEGDSAAGPAKNARDSRFQETLPIRGKILNVLKDPKGRAVASEEIVNILAQLGFDPKSEDPYSKLRVGGKIICLADPDPDGPLTGDTEVDIRYEGVWQTLTLQELASETWRTREYEVVSWNGRSFCLGDAQDCRITDYVNSLVKIEFEDGSKLRVSPEHKFPVWTDKPFFRGVSPDATGLFMVRAADLKTGERIVSAGHGDNLAEPRNILGKTCTFSYIKKHKIVSCEPTPVYCLTVNGFHNFMLANGVLSSNCHINTLLLSLLWKYLPGLFTRGMVYVAETPEFYAVDKKGKPYFASKPDALAALLESKGVKADVEHIKGYGEVSSDILKLLAFDPRTRCITRIIPSVSPNGDVEFVKLMSGSSESRKELLGI